MHHSVIATGDFSVHVCVCWKWCVFGRCGVCMCVGCVCRWCVCVWFVCGVCMVCVCGCLYVCICVCWECMCGVCVYVYVYMCVLGVVCVGCVCGVCMCVNICVCICVCELMFKVSSQVGEVLSRHSVVLMSIHTSWILKNEEKAMLCGQSLYFCQGILSFP